MRAIFILMLLLIFQHLFTTNAQASDTALILHSNFSDAHTNVKSQLEADGYTVTLSTSGTVPENLISNYDVVYDMKYNNNLGSNGKTRYQSFVQNGGVLVVVGENQVSYSNTNNTIAAFINNWVGGSMTILGTTGGGSCGNDCNMTQTNTDVTDSNYTSVGVYPYGAYFSGDGTWVVKSTSGKVLWMRWSGSELTSGYTGAVYVTFDINQFTSTYDGTNMAALISDTYESILSTASTSTTTGTSSGISGGQSTQVTTDRARAATIESTSGASDNSVYIEQAGSSNTIAITQSGTAGNHIRGIGQNMADITGDSNDLEIKQGASSAGGVNLIELMIDGDTNDIELWQDRNTDGSFDLNSSGDHIIKLEIDGNLNDVHIEQRANSGSDGHYTDLDINGNSNIIDVMQASSFEKQLFTNITGNSNTLNIDQTGNSTKYMEIDLVGNGHSVTANQKDTGNHKASISLTYGSAASTVNLLQEGATDQSYSLEQTCYTVGGCSASVTQN